MNKVILGTRESPLAMAQANIAANKIKKCFPELQIEIKGFTTQGDRILDQKLELIGGKGLFVKELELALLKGDIHFAVHSAKDMPTDLPEGLDIIGVLPRDDCRDVLITKEKSLDGLKEGAVIGTSSPRRQLLLKSLREDLTVKMLRGNILTRIEKYHNGEYDGIILAKAGLDRLHLHLNDMITFDIKTMIPAVCQGIIALEGKLGNEINQVIEAVNCKDTYKIMICERGFMKEVGGGCTAPVAACAELNGENINMTGMIEQNGKAKIAELSGHVSDYALLGRELAEKLMK